MRDEVIVSPAVRPVEPDAVRASRPPERGSALIADRGQSPRCAIDATHGNLSRSLRSSEVRFSAIERSESRVTIGVAAAMHVEGMKKTTIVSQRTWAIAGAPLRSCGDST